MNKKIADIGLLLIGFLWGLSFVITKIGLNDGMDPIYMLTLRFGISSIILYLFFRKEISYIKFRDLKKFIFLGIILAVAYLLQTVGSKYTTVSKISFYTALNIIFVPYISWLLHRIAPNIYTYIATIICVIGIGIIAYVPNIEMLTFNKGDILVIISAIFFGTHVGITGLYSKKYNINIMMLVQMSTIALTFAFINLVMYLIPNVDSGIRLLNIKEFSVILYTGIVATCLCLFLQAFFQKYTNATNASILMSTESIFAPFLAFLILNESLTLNVYVGGALVVIAVILSEIKS